jgi:hypothetical protein
MEARTPRSQRLGATVTIVVRPTATRTITNSVAVTNTEPDEKPDNNTDTEDTTVNLFPTCWWWRPKAGSCGACG